MEIPVESTPARYLAEHGYGQGVDLEALEDCLLFMRTAKLSLQYFYRAFAAADLTPGKYSVLSELAAAAPDGLSPSEIANRLGITRPSTTSLLDELKSQKLIHRRASNEDRRRLEITLSEQGKVLLEGFLPGHYQLMADFLPVTKSERDMLRKVLGGLEQKLIEGDKP